MIQREVLTDARLEENSEGKGKGHYMRPSHHKFCHIVKTPKCLSCQTQFVLPSKSVQYAVQKSSLNSSVLEGPSTAWLFLIENNEPDVLHILGNPKRIPSAMGPDLRWMEWDHMLLGHVFPLELPGLSPLSLHVVLGVCIPNLSWPHPALWHRWPQPQLRGDPALRGAAPASRPLRAWPRVHSDVLHSCVLFYMPIWSQKMHKRKNSCCNKLPGLSFSVWLGCSPGSPEQGSASSSLPAWHLVGFQLDQNPGIYSEERVLVGDVCMQ